jgi:hypothetical protein
VLDAVPPYSADDRVEAYRLPIGMVDGKQAFATLPQLRNIDSKRHVKKIGASPPVIILILLVSVTTVNFGAQIGLA